MHVAGFPRRKGSSRGGSIGFHVWWGCLGLLCLFHATFATSVQSLQYLLKHPHYADDGHQHARQNVSHIRSQHQGEVQQDHVSTLPAIPSSSNSKEIDRSASFIATPDSRSPSRSHWSEQPSVLTSHHHNESPSTQESVQDSSRTSPPKVKTTMYRGTSPTTAIPRDFYRFMTEPPDHPGRKQRKNFVLTPPPTENRVDKRVDDVREANKHYMKMMSIGRCREPKPMVIRVKDYYPDPSKEYLPRCTLLHRCSEDTGCCDTEELQCMPKAMQEVALSFYVIEATMSVHQMGIHNAVETLLFVNHTACECLPARVQDKPKAQRDDHRHQHHTRDQSNPTNHEQSRCRECPIPFFKREPTEGRCSCDCFDRQKPCIRVKRGREPLLEIERRCVETGKCHIPECEFGRFDSTLGRCPKKPEDYQRKGGNGNKNHQNNHSHHRWNFLERD